VRRFSLLAIARIVVASPTAAQPPLVHQEGALSAHGIAVTAKGAILIDANDGSVLWGKDERRRLRIASTTKIMTAIVAMERLRPHAVVTVDKSVTRVQPFKEGLRPGEQVEAWKLFYGTLLMSGNDTALALAIGAGGSRSRFVALMNEKARVLGLKDSHFRSPSGPRPRQLLTAWDMASRPLCDVEPALPGGRARASSAPWAAPTYAKIYVNHNHISAPIRRRRGETGWTTLAKHRLVASPAGAGCI
jgi:D-alanyl-D-alanine carboxypeptidase